ncbi:MAG: hypothetical protein AAFU64_06740, partial [Bacteroidota bacterium]
MKETLLKKEIYAVLQSDEVILEFVLNYASQGFYILDCESEQVWISPKLWKTLGYEAETFKRPGALDLLKTIELVPNIKNGSLSGSNSKREVIRIRHQKGHLLYFYRAQQEIPGQTQPEKVLCCLEAFFPKLKMEKNPGEENSQKSEASQQREYASPQLPQLMLLNTKKVKKTSKEIIQHLQLAVEAARLGIWELEVASGDLKWNHH